MASEYRRNGWALGRYASLLVLFLVLFACGVVGWHIYAQASREPLLPEQVLAGSARPLYLQPHVPKELAFAGERIPLEKVDVWESLDRELCVNGNWHSQMLQILKKAPRYFPIIEPILKREGVPEDFKYLAVAESNLNELAYSPSHAAGIWQFLEGTAKDYGLEVNEYVDERYHLEASTHAACAFLKDSYRQFGSWAMAAASYNMGRAGLQRVADSQYEGGYYNLHLNVQTGRYFYRLLAFKLIMEQPLLYGFYLQKEELYAPYECDELQVDTAISDLARFARQQGGNYKTLRLANPWLRAKELPAKEGKTYTIRMLTEKGRKQRR